ncbi:MAG: hypothetical protein K6F22_05120 [Prevotella sp.]|uniref:hypothetical protein n=1 Tax=Prevotella sp. khp7 TaxID=1761885 RepID=UPI0008B67A63|nr:hypothetical protein [Prevotella sp. khp7]MCR5470304.1 hypothetical protein [Prevotella sp.]SEW00506.1 hypothetical protein SAMN04487827_1192 [Prevotella sp. khp7]
MKKLLLSLAIFLGVVSTSMASPVVGVPSPNIQEVTNVQKNGKQKVIVVYNPDGTIKEIIVIKSK